MAKYLLYLFCIMVVFTKSIFRLYYDIIDAYWLNALFNLVVIVICIIIFITLFSLVKEDVKNGKD